MFHGNAWPRELKRRWQLGAMKVRLAIAAMSLTAAGLVGVVGYEGWCNPACIPIPGDVPTLGFGNTTREDGTPVQLGDTTTPPKALARAAAEISKYEGAIKQCVHVPLTQNEYNAYTSLTYNIGTTAFCGSTLVKLLNEGKYAEACAQISRWDMAGGKPVLGLTRRRAAERALCERD